MEISGIGLDGAYVGSLSGTGATEQPENDVIVEDPVVVEPEPEEDIAGVLRNLMEGHYKGVSDVRLRINFAEELAAMEAEAQKAAVEEKIDELLAAVSAGLEPLLGLGEPEGATVEGKVAADATGGEEPVTVESAAEQFASAVGAAKDEFLGAENASVEDLENDLTSAFDVLVGSLWELFGASEEASGSEAPDDGSGEDDGGDGLDVEALEGVDVPSETPSADEPGDEPDVGEYIAAMESSFAAGMAELLDSLSGASLLPELSEPSGNGGAYEKFLAIYNELWGIEDDVNVTVEA